MSEVSEVQEIEIKGLYSYERHLGDYAKDTGHLSLLEHGVYTILTDRCFASGKPIPEKQIYRYARAQTSKEKRAVDAVLDEFFSLEDGWYFSHMVQAYWQAKDKRAQTSKENGKLGGRPPRKTDETDKHNNNNSLENEKPNQNLTKTYQEPNPNLKKPVPLSFNPLYKSKAQQQQQLREARVNAAPANLPVDDSPTEKISAKPTPAAEAEPASTPLPTADLPTASKAARGPADPLPETSHHPAAPEPRTATAEPVPADLAADSENDLAALWEQLTPQQRYVAAQQAGARDAEQCAVAAWWQFSQTGQQILTDVLHAIGVLPTNGEAATGTSSPVSDNLPHPEQPETAIESPLTDENGGEKGIIHANPVDAKNDDLKTVSANPVVTDPVPINDAAHLRTMGVPESIDVAVWQNFEAGLREKGHWSSAACFTLARQLRHTIEAGADGNALLEWATVRGLMDLPDAWQRMQDDAAKRERNTTETVTETVTGTPTETVSQTVTETLAEPLAEPLPQPTTDHSDKPSENLNQTDSKPKQNLEKSNKGKKKKEKRETKKPHDVSDDTWADFVEHRKNRKSLVTERVIEMFRKQAQKAGISLDEAMQISVTRGWIGFEAEWLESAKNKRMHHAGNVAAHLMPNASGRLPGESVSDAALRVYLEDLKEQGISHEGSPVLGLLNTQPAPAIPALPLIINEENEDEQFDAALAS